MENYFLKSGKGVAYAKNYLKYARTNKVLFHQILLSLIQN